MTSLAPYLRAFLLVAIATAGRFALGFLDADQLPFVTYFPAILLAAMWGGIGPGALATVLSLVIGWFFFFLPKWSFTVPTSGAALSLVAFVLMSAMIVWIADAYRREQERRKLLMREMQHRTKNSMAITQSIVSRTLADEPEKAKAIVGRLSSVAATNNLLTESPCQRLTPKAILLTELEPYAEGRVTIREADCPPLDANLARSFALIVHELATNAVKYGALSTPEGRVSVRCSGNGTYIAMLWEETKGPAVDPPTRDGFGSKLISALVRSHRGAAEFDYRPTGLVCSLQVENGSKLSAASDQALSNYA